MARMTNFGIAGYVHATRENRRDEQSAAPLMQRGRGFGFNAETYLDSRFSEMDKEFEQIVGIGSEEFMKRLNAQAWLIVSLMDLFDSPSMKEFEEVLSGPAKEHFETMSNSMEIIVRAAKVSSYTNMLYALHTDQADEALKAEIQNFADAAEGFSTYQSLLESIDKGARSNTKSKTKENIAMRQVLLTKILEEAKEVQQLADGSTVLGGKASFEGVAIENFERDLKKVADMLGSTKFTVKEVEKLQNNLRGRANRDLKGRVLGELASAETANILTKSIIEGIEGQVVEAIELVGRQVSEKEININVGGVERSGGKVVQLASTTKDFSFKDMKADVSVKTSSGDLKISTKRYNRLQAKFVTQSSGQTIGSMLALAKNPTMVTNLMYNNGAVLFNALTDLYINHEVINKKTEDRSTLVLGDSIDNSFRELDAAYDGILTQLVLVIMDAHLSMETVGMMDINGMLIPSPVYYKAMMMKLIHGVDSVNPSSHIDFHRNAGTKAIESIMTDNKYDANKKGKGGYQYASPALQRNIAVKSALLNNKVSVRSTFYERNRYITNILRGQGW